MASVKTNKNKNPTPLLRTTFDDKKLCLWAQNDILTLKVLKMQFIFVSVMIRNIAHSISNVPDHGSVIRENAFLGPLE